MNARFHGFIIFVHGSPLRHPIIFDRKKRPRVKQGLAHSKQALQGCRTLLHVLLCRHFCPFFHGKGMCNALLLGWPGYNGAGHRNKTTIKLMHFFSFLIIFL